MSKTPHTDPCRTCGHRLIATTIWRAADQDQRTIWRAAGLRPHASRRLCGICYRRATAAGTLTDHERTTVPQDLVVDEWRRLDDKDGSRAQRVRRLAPRLGMTPDALERALDRAGVRGDPQARGLCRVVRDGTCSGCTTCRIRRAELGATQGELAGLARKLAADPDSPTLRNLLATAQGRVADAAAALDAHLDVDHQDVAA